jgi:hypothetical protein
VFITSVVIKISKLRFVKCYHEVDTTVGGIESGKSLELNSKIRSKTYKSLDKSIKMCLNFW